MNAIEIRNLTKSYGKYRGIMDLSLSIPEGEIFGYIGPNGAGKSTTIRTLLNFLHADNGSASIFGLDCTRDTKEIKRMTGYLPSEVNYYDDMKVKDLLEYSAKYYRKDCSSRIRELTDILELDTGKKIDSLSFGNKKKVAIIQALLHEPRLLILDEPTGGLDPLMQNRFFEVLREENKKGVTIFFSSHVLSEVERMCHRVGIIKGGSILKVELVEKLKAEKYKKIKVEFAEAGSAQTFDIQGAKEWDRKQQTVDFLYKGAMDELIKNLSDHRVENLWIEEPPLEKIFMHYYEKEGK